jgi:putative ATPase
MTDLFEREQETKPAADRPLPDRLRPRTLEEIVGQDHLVGAGAPIRKMIDNGRLVSMILWGPPGCGKTTLARILSTRTDLHFEQLSAVFSGVQDLRKAFESARVRQRNGQGTLLFVDEIHRFNKSQQDAFLPVVEDGTIVLIGATTENPSFELNAALLSRTQVLVLRRLDDAGLDTLLARAEVLSVAEQILSQDQMLDNEALLKLIQRRAPLYDKTDDAHYNLISALHKSVRGSDADAALYWLARMLAGGEHPEYIARRMTRMAVEDIGLADPRALPTCIAAWEAFERLGSPEGELALAQAVIYLATAPKSNAAYTAYGAAQRTARETGSLMPPKAILNAPTKLMKDEGYGAGYEYDHDTAEGFSGQDYFPDEMARVTFYDPPERGFEREIRKRLEYWKKLRGKRG